MSGEATNEIYIFFHFTSEIEAIFKKNHLNFLFIIYNYISKEVHARCTFFKLSLVMALSLDNEHESMLKGNQIKVLNSIQILEL